MSLGNSLYNERFMDLVWRRNMKKRRAPINLILALLAVGLAGGCETTKVGKKKKEEKFSTFRMHLEELPNNARWVMPAQIYRENPQIIHVHRVPFIDERNIVEAAVIDDIRTIDGEQVNFGKAIGVRFDRTGKWLLESTTVANRGKRIAIHSYFPEGRWLGAKVIESKMSDGVFIFTPDASLEEMERLCDGLNAVAKELETAKSW